MASKAIGQFSIGKPVRIPKALQEGLGAAIEAHLTAAEKLTAVLDKADGDPNLEPYLGANGTGISISDHDQEAWARSDSSDREQDSGEEP